MEPGAVGERRRHHGAEGDPGDHRPVRCRWCALDEHGHRHEQHAPRGELPRRERERWHRWGPSLAEHETGRRHEHRGERGGQTHGIDATAAVEHEEGHAGHTGRCTEETTRRRTVTEHRPCHDHQGRGRERHEGGGDATRQTLRRHVDEDEEHADVEGAEDRRTPPPRASRRRAGDGDEQQRSWQGPCGRAEERAVGGEEVVGDGVVGAPRDGRQSGDGDGPPLGFHGS